MNPVSPAPSDVNGVRPKNAKRHDRDTPLAKVAVNALLHCLARVNQLRRLAHHRLADDDFPWRKWAKFVAMELRTAEPGNYAVEGSTRPLPWPKACAATVLCHGRFAVFAVISDAPAEIAEQVELGVADASNRRSRIIYTPDEIGRALRVTAADKLAARVWCVTAIDMTPEEWGAMMKRRKNENRRARRHAAGMRPQSKSIAAEARRLGIKPNTLRKRLSRGRQVGHPHFGTALYQDEGIESKIRDEVPKTGHATGGCPSASSGWA